MATIEEMIDSLIDGPSIPPSKPDENLIIFFRVPNEVLTVSCDPSMVADTACEYFNFTFEGIDFSDIINLTLRHFINLRNEDPNYDGHMSSEFQDECGKVWEFTAQNACSKLVTKFILMSTDRETIGGFTPIDSIPDDDDCITYDDDDIPDEGDDISPFKNIPDNDDGLYD